MKGEMKVKLNDWIDREYGLSKLPEQPAFAMAYVPYQAFNIDVYSADHGFTAGTMFPELNKPFYGSKCGDGNDKT
jgi:hypothetical protein